jgi:hypothetical protein
MVLTDTAVPIPRPAKNSAVQASGWLAGLGAVAGFGALATSSCCVLPLALAKRLDVRVPGKRKRKKARHSRRHVLPGSADTARSRKSKTHSNRRASASAAPV